jgi:hypothetical protein
MIFGNKIKFTHICRSSAIAVASILLICSCTSIKSVNTSYTDFQSDSLKSGFSASTIAILPLSATNEYKQCSHNAEAALIQELTTLYPQIRIIGSDELKKLDTDQILRQVNASDTPFSPKAQDVRIWIKDKTGCDYVLYGLLRTQKFADSGTDTMTTRKIQLLNTELHAQVWNVSTNRVVWEGAGGVSALRNRKTATTLDQAKSAAGNLADRMYRKSIEKPMSEKELIQLHNENIKETAFSTKCLIGGLTLIAGLVIYFIISP